MNGVNVPAEIAALYRQQGTMNFQSAIITFAVWLPKHRAELEDLAYMLHGCSFTDLFEDILDRGLEEVRTIYFEKLSREREDSRSEKDCLWSDGCD